VVIQARFIQRTQMAQTGLRPELARSLEAALAFGDKLIPTAPLPQSASRSAIAW